MTAAAAPVQTRKPYTRSDYNYLLSHYTQTENHAAECAAQLGRTLGSLKSFISRNPELQKRPRE